MRFPSLKIILELFLEVGDILLHSIWGGLHMLGPKIWVFRIWVGENVEPKTSDSEVVSSQLVSAKELIFSLR